MTRWVVGIVAATALLAGSVSPTLAQKASRACRKEIGAKLGKLVKTGQAVIDACHKERNKGKFAGQCNDLGAADVKGKYQKALGAATKGIDKKCLPGDPVLANYQPGADAAAVLFPLIEDALEQSGSGLRGSPSLVGDKARVKCHAQIAKAASKNVDETLKLGVKCQNGVDKNALVFGALDPICNVDVSKTTAKGQGAIVKACVTPAIAGADVGSCEPLPTCVTQASTATGRDLLAAIYGEPPQPGCGNFIVEPGLGEQCDDGNTAAGDGCDENCLASDCAPAGTRRTITVRFQKPMEKNVAGLKIALDYPEGQVGIPGFADDAQVKSRVTVFAGGLTAIADRDFEIEVNAANFPTIDPGNYFAAEFDDCAGGASPLPAQFKCSVREAFDESAKPVSGVTCSVSGI